MACKMCEALQEGMDDLHEENKRLRRRISLLLAQRRVQDVRSKEVKIESDREFVAMCHAPLTQADGFVEEICARTGD